MTQWLCCSGLLLVNVWEINRDHKYRENPLGFLPERTFYPRGRGEHESPIGRTGTTLSHFFMLCAACCSESQTSYLFEANDMNSDLIRVLVPWRFKVYFKDLSVYDWTKTNPFRLTFNKVIHTSSLYIYTSKIDKVIYHYSRSFLFFDFGYHLCVLLCLSYRIISLSSLFFLLMLCITLHYTLFCCYCSRFCIPFFKQSGNV